MRVRFAPSPTGQLHVGNARTALFNWLLAHGKDGTFILRIEDTDAERSTRESEASILEDLRWLGLDWDEGPDVGGAHGPYRQSERLHLYASYANELIAGGHAYHCFCSPAKLESRSPGGSRGRAAAEVRRHLPAAVARRRRRRGSTPASGRSSASGCRSTSRSRFQDLVRGEVTFSTEVIGDFGARPIRRPPAYNFAVVVDDALMEITHVIRGEDHISNTPRQVLLYQALGFTPPEFAHLSLVMGPDHTPLSKRHGATSVAEFRARGYLPEALVNYLALIGWSPGGDEELLPIDELARRFAIEDVGHSAGVFDQEKLAWMNRHYMKAAAPARLAAESVRYFLARGYLRRRTDEAMEYLVSVLPMAVGSVDRLEEIPDRLRFLFEFDAAGGAGARRGRRACCTSRGAREVIAALAEEIDGPLLDRDAFRAMANRVKERTGQKGKALFHPIRVALTGEGGGPELDLAVPAIDRGAALRRRSARPRADRRACRERAIAFAGTTEADRAPSAVTRSESARNASDRLRHQPRRSRRCAAGRVRRLRVGPRADRRVDEALARWRAPRESCRSSASTRRRSSARRAAACTRASSPSSQAPRDYSVAGARRGGGPGRAAARRARRHRGSAQRRRHPADGGRGRRARRRPAGAARGVARRRRGESVGGRGRARADRDRREHRAGARGAEGARRVDRRARRRRAGRV